MKKVPVVVTGIGVICPLGRNTEEFWSNLIVGKSGVARATTPEFDGLEDAYAGQVQDGWIAEAVPSGYENAERMSRLALVAAAEAVKNSGIDPEALAGDLTGIVVGQCQATANLKNGTFLPFHEATDAVAGHYGLGGPRVVISTACAAGGNAVGAGRDLIWDGAADVVLAGGVDDLQKGTHLGFALLQAISDGPTAPYSKSQGLSLGEGAAFLVLETAEHAAARGATVLAEVGGYGLSADAYHSTAPDPTAKGPLRAVQRALDDAELGTDAISYVNGHGTGTPANDRMERKAMKTLFGERVGEVPISSTKAALGHSLGASGAIEAVTCVLAISNQTAPPTVNFEEPYPEDFNFVPNLGQPTKIDVTLSNNYAFGGNNCSLLLARPHRLPDRSKETLNTEVVISGLGISSGFGLGLDAWREGVASGKSAITQLQTFDGTPFGSNYGTEYAQLGAKPLAASGLWRHLGPYGRHALAATHGAFTDAGLRTNGPGREQVGLVLATTYGPVATAFNLAKGMNSEEGASALDFANATVNAAAGAVCQALTLRGPTTTIASGGASAILALENAMNLIRTGQAERIVLLAIDEICEAVLMERAKYDPLAADGKLAPYDKNRHGTVLGTASVALLLEAKDVVEARGGTAYASVRGVAGAGVTGSDQVTAERVFRDVLKRADVEAADVQLLLGSGAGAERDIHELTAIGEIFGPDLLVTAPKSLTGECEAASGAVNLLSAALAVHSGLVPGTANLLDPLAEVDVQFVTEPLDDAKVSLALASASSPQSSFAAALLGGVS